MVPVRHAIPQVVIFEILALGRSAAQIIVRGCEPVKAVVIIGSGLLDHAGMLVPAESFGVAAGATMAHLVDALAPGLVRVLLRWTLGERRRLVFAGASGLFEEPFEVGDTG